MRMTAPASRRAAFVSLGTAVALALTACAGSGGPDVGATKKIDVSTNVPGAPVTLTMAYTDDPPTKALIEGFTKKHPNVTIKPQQTQFKDYVKSIKLSISSGAPPDIAQYNPGAMNSLVPAGLVLNLDPWAKAYGWDAKFPKSSLEVLSSDRTAKQFGTGGLYAAPGAMSVLGVFYNKSLLTKAGVKGTPRTLAEFETAMRKAKSAGQAPLSVGALEVGGFQVWNALLNVTGDVSAYRSWAYGRPKATIETPAAQKAAQTLIDWTKEGYIPSSSNATADTDAQAAFANGKNTFIITGNWTAAMMESKLKDDVGFFLLPSATAGRPAVASGASVAFAISSKTKHPNVAAAFLDYLASPEAAKIQFETGFMPVDPKADLDAEGLRGEIRSAFGPVAQKNGIVPFPDFASPGMIDQLTPGIQGLISGKMTADDFLGSLQKSWNDHHGS